MAAFRRPVPQTKWAPSGRGGALREGVSAGFSTGFSAGCSAWGVSSACDSVFSTASGFSVFSAMGFLRR